MPSSLTFSSVRAPRASRSGVSIWADTSQVARLARDLRRASPEAWKECRLALRAAAEPVLREAQANASYSSRIPGSMKIRTGRGNVKIVAGGDAAPDAAPIENKGKGLVRHPVFGNRGVWTSKNSHPAFLSPAFDAHRAQAARDIEAAVVAAVTRVISGR